MLRIATALPLATCAMALSRQPPIHAGANVTEHLADVSSLCYDAVNVKTGVPEYAKLALGVHRKTGFVLAGQTAQCFDGDARRVMAFTFSSLPPGEKAVHFARDPIDFAVSNFLYDKVTSTERGTLKAGRAGHFRKLCHRYFPDVVKTLPLNTETESLREYLVRVPEDDALRMIMCQSKNILDGMVKATKWCHEHESCIQVSLADFMESSESYMATWEKITSFAGIRFGERERQCLRAQDINSDSFEGHDKHCTTREVDGAERDRIKEKSARMDADSFGGYYQQARRAMGL